MILLNVFPLKSYDLIFVKIYNPYRGIKKTFQCDKVYSEKKLTWK